MNFAGVPLGNGYIGFAPGNATLATLTGSPAAKILSPIGPAFACSGTNRATFTIATPVTPYTLAAIFLWNGTNAATQDICGALATTVSQGVGLSMGSTGIPGIRAHSAQVLSTLPAIVAGRSYFLAISGVSTVGFSIAYTTLDTGQVFSQFVSDAGAILSATSSFTIGNLGDGSRPLNGSIGPTMFSNVLCSLPQLVQWASDPWSFWYPG
jgi:hypothetical protein